MRQNGIVLTRRRLLGGLVSVAGASTAAGAGTMAYFTDSESSNANTIQAGAIDLTTDGDDQDVTFLALSRIVPGDNGSQSVMLGNDGSIDGNLEIEVDEWRDYENGIQSGEGNDGTSNQGELQDYLRVQAFVDGSAVTNPYYVKDIPEDQTLSTDTTIVPGGSSEFTVEWEFEEPSNGNAKDAQSDSVEIDLTFRLVQSGGG